MAKSMGESRKIPWLDFSWLKFSWLGESRKDPISLAFNAGRSEQDNASPRLFHDTIQLLQQLLLFTDNAMHGATSIPFMYTSSWGLLNSTFGP